MDATTPRNARIFSASGINILCGIWLIIAPFVLNYENLQVAIWNDVILGILVALLAIVRTFGVAWGGATWVTGLLGVWLIIAPFVLNYGNNSVPRWNDIILGIIVVIFAWSGAAVPRPPASV